MSDEIKQTRSDAPAEPNKTIAIVVVAALLVLAAGVGVGLALNRGNKDDALEAPVGGVTPDPGTAQVPTQTPPAGRPVTPAPAGSTLATVTTPPESTLAMIDADKLKADAEYKLTFSPFGYGPPQGGQTIVIRISKAEAENESARGMDLNGRNMLAVVGPGTTVEAGGTHRGRLTFRSQGDLLIPVVSEIEAQ